MRYSLNLVNKEIKITENAIKELKLLRKDYDRLVSRYIDNKLDKDHVLIDTGCIFNNYHKYKDKKTMIYYGVDKLKPEVMRDILYMSSFRKNISDIDKHLKQLRTKLKKLVLEQNKLRHSFFIDILNINQ